jgi:hypothetical protein
LDLVAISLVFFFSSFLIQCFCSTKTFLLMSREKKERRRLIASPLLPFSSRHLFLSLSLLVYDLPPFFATLVFVFLLADASPFLLDFFLVAIIS